MFQDQRDKIRERLNRKSTKPTTFKEQGGRFAKIIAQHPIRPKYGLFKGTDTFSWNLETTGASQTDDEEVIVSDDGRIEQIILNFPAGSEYSFFIYIQIDNVQVFPSKLSQELRGDNQTKTYDVDIPFQRDSRIKVIMTSNAGLESAEERAVWIDITVRYKSRLRT
jgi:hypothetical protein